MSQAPVSEQITQGYKPPRNTQFSVFLDNRVGRLLDLVDIFEGHALTLAGLSVVDAADHAVVRLLTSNAELARRLLKRANMAYSEAEVLVIEISENKTLPELCRCLLAAELNIHYAYPLLIHPRGWPAVVMHCDDIILSSQILRRKLFTLLAENDLGDNATGSAPEG